MLRPLEIIHENVVAYAVLTLLGVICLLYSVWALVAYPLLPRRLGTAADPSGISAGFRMFSWSLTLTGAYRLDLSASQRVRDGPPVILALNRPSLIEHWRV